MRIAKLASPMFLAAVLAPLLAVPPAAADVVNVDPGPIARNRVIVGTGQNLPPLAGNEDYVAGPSRSQITYYTSGRAAADQLAVSTAARRTVNRWIRQRCDGTTRQAVRRCRVAVVFDIDETLLANFPVPGGAAGEPSCLAANQPVVDLYQDLQARGVRVAILTGRSDDERQDTIACLQQRGVSGWSSLTTRPADSTGSAAMYKALVRRTMVKRGARIIASIGDQVSDMSYGWLAYGFLMPNPVYYIA